MDDKKSMVGIPAHRRTLNNRQRCDGRRYRSENRRHDYPCTVRRGPGMVHHVAGPKHVYIAAALFAVTHVGRNAGRLSTSRRLYTRALLARLFVA